ncbi:hypothetical protein RB2168 [Rhodopirellula baltica SH 1]|uniref:Uncharacterized protein n=1 Tax=Rhodopirellula baltica (strain DSM 10527 / NCIMB 13988 / SH1) TaxID=243090 RepID=Q7UWA2_RHOBA|nr:hypothetical protein RB2168 [Rhodopirellula baltica SH 1]
MMPEKPDFSRIDCLGSQKSFTMWRRPASKNQRHVF